MKALQAAENYGGEWGFYNEVFIHQFWPELTHKIHKQQQKHWV